MSRFGYQIKWVTICIIFTIITIMNTNSSHGNAIKSPNVKGQFYTADPKKLSKEMDRYFDAAKVDYGDKEIEILIAPHAGYVYSGSVAAYVYNAVKDKDVKTVFILAPSHYVGFDGISVWPSGGFETPLGIVPINEDLAGQLIDAHPKFIDAPQVFEKEHSLEVQLPFLQKIYDDFNIVPILIGQPDFKLLDHLAETLNSLMGNREDILVVVSSDLSHFHPDKIAKEIDRATLDAVTAFQPDVVYKQCRLKKMEMCGFMGVTAGVLLAQKRGYTQSELLKYATSGDVTGDRKSVVGYASVIFYKDTSGEKKSQKDMPDDESRPKPLTLEQRRELLRIAKETVWEYVNTGHVKEFESDDPRLQETEGAFVTLHKNEMLRGCIGHIIGSQPLYKTVRDMAVASASQDPRFPPVKSDELKNVDVEVSVLSKPWQVKDPNMIEMGVHGVIVSRGFRHRGIFLPQVATETGWDREQFMSQLCFQKAGLPPDAWKDPRTRIEIFTADVFSEKDFESGENYNKD